MSRRILFNPTYKELFGIDYDIKECEDCQLAGNDWLMNKEGDYECACDTCPVRPYPRHTTINKEAQYDH